jgi:hypothetical protein
MAGAWPEYFPNAIMPAARFSPRNRLTLAYLPVQMEGNSIALLSLDDLLSETVAYLERVLRENELDQQIVFLRGTYGC